MLFPRSHNLDLSNLEITSLNGRQIEQVPSHEYLGIWLDDELAFKTHVTKLVKKLKIKM